MTSAKKMVVAAAAMLAMVCGAHAAGVSVNAVRVGAVDVAATAKFYQTAFGLKEVNRFEPKGVGLEILMNFGDTVDAAKANTGAQIVVMHRDTDAVKDSIPHLILTVTDIAETVKAVTGAGGKVQRAPFEFGKTGIMIGMVTDPAGNIVEMIQPVKH
jgi:predicted enzyme related to lactoylglutathione lyase